MNRYVLTMGLAMCAASAAPSNFIDYLEHPPELKGLVVQEILSTGTRAYFVRYRDPEHFVIRDTVNPALLEQPIRPGNLDAAIGRCGSTLWYIGVSAPLTVHTWDKDTSPPDNDIAFTVDCQRPILAEILHLGIQDVLAGGFHFASNSFCYTNTFTPVKWKEAVQPRRISGTVIQNASGAPVRSELTNTAIGSVPKGSSTKVTRLYEYEPGPGLPAWCPALVKYYIWADGRPITPKKRPLVYKVLAMELAASPLPDADYMPSAFTGTNVIQGFKIAQGKEFYERGGQWIMVRKLKQAIRLPSWVFPVLAALTLLGAAMALARSARARNQQKQQKGESDAWFI